VDGDPEDDGKWTHGGRGDSWHMRSSIFCREGGGGGGGARGERTSLDSRQGRRRRLSFYDGHPAGEGRPSFCNEGATADAWQGKQWVRRCMNSVIIRLNHNKYSVYLMNITYFCDD